MAERTFQGVIEKLEIARGHDGLLRGPPEPVIAFAIYVTDGVTVRLLGRSLHRFFPRAAAFPSEVTTADTHLPSCHVEAQVPFSFVALALALEEDGGGDIQRMYGAFERHDALSVWAPQRAEVEPLPIAGVHEAWRAPLAVDLCVEGASVASTCQSDKWIGAVCWAMAPRPGTPRSNYRLPFLAADKRNDWTALVSIAH